MKLTAGKTVSLSIQHVLAMYAGAVMVPLIVGDALGLTPEQLTYLVSADILMCGIATLLQVWKNRFFGIGLLGCLGMYLHSRFSDDCDRFEIRHTGDLRKHYR
ncbi:solute carrier family 23 protein [Bacillus sonorensis]|nr:solute carrier family 23 protein [Bacillus sonorensis]